MAESSGRRWNSQARLDSPDWWPRLERSSLYHRTRTRYTPQPPLLSCASKSPSAPPRRGNHGKLRMNVIRAARTGCDRRKLGRAFSQPHYCAAFPRALLARWPAMHFETFDLARGRTGLASRRSAGASSSARSVSRLALRGTADTGSDAGSSPSPLLSCAAKRTACSTPLPALWTNQTGSIKRPKAA